MESRQPLKLRAFDSLTPYHWPLAQLAARRALNAEVPGSRPGRAASQRFTGVSFKGQDGTLRTYKSGFDSSCPYHLFGRSSNRAGHRAPNAEIGVGISPLVDQFPRCRPTGEALDCRSRLDGFDSRTPRQVFRGCRLTAGSLVLTQRVRVQLSPALPRGCRLIGQDRCLSSSGCGIVPRRPYQVMGYKLWRRNTRLLIERAQFDSVMAHQVVPR